MNQTLAPTRRPRWMLPLFILVVAAAFGYWGVQQRGQQSEEIRLHVISLCQAISEGRDLTGTVNPIDPFTEQRTIAELQRVCASAQRPEQLEVVVTPGDIESIAPVHDQVTHTALLRVGGVNQLGLRVKHLGDPGQVRILGYWLPQGDAMP